MRLEEHKEYKSILCPESASRPRAAAWVSLSLSALGPGHCRALCPQHVARLPGYLGPGCVLTAGGSGARAPPCCSSTGASSELGHLSRTVPWRRCSWRPARGGSCRSRRGRDSTWQAWGPQPGTLVGHGRTQRLSGTEETLKGEPGFFNVIDYQTLDPEEHPGPRAAAPGSERAPPRPWLGGPAPPRPAPPRPAPPLARRARSYPSPRPRALPPSRVCGLRRRRAHARAALREPGAPERWCAGTLVRRNAGAPERWAEEDAEQPQAGGLYHRGRNPLFQETLGLKPHLLVLNKMDLADLKERQKIIQHLEGEGLKNVIFTNCVKDENIKQVIPMVTELVGSSYRYHRGENPEYCIMVIGVPNVGKSSLINSLRRQHLRKGTPPGRRWFSCWDDTSEPETPARWGLSFHQEDPLTAWHAVSWACRMRGVRHQARIWGGGAPNLCARPMSVNL
ncbi:mitochondrial ribosome-associated GTPase 1 isoform X2 [Hippopotamus amphibius kiboko]|uniref:mitochondrial ribosome-associated GTPase 1 isoform X2 n=1 Tax=Hippopotamus amphibius kiboko TaxID=575201 RepID=UPI002594A11D|nr:mitochondrial ribosome-associated GTPase 1 isoform X2 [Hippopotamus amphibius kiboko]